MQINKHFIQDLKEEIRLYIAEIKSNKEQRAYENQAFNKLKHNKMISEWS